MGHTTRHITSALAALILLSGCDPTKRLTEGQALLKSNRIIVDAREADKEELQAIVKQKPNRRVLGIPFYLHVYNLPNPERIPAWRAKKDARIDRINARRTAKGKEPKPYRPTRAEWLRETVGEAPVFLDSAQTERSAQQLELYMNKEGWFHAQVSDTVVLHERAWYGGRLHAPKARVTYRIEAGEAYHLRNVRYTVDDSVIMSFLRGAREATLLHAGDRFDDDALDAERTRITAVLRDAGYLYFTRDLIQYVADTTVGGRQVDLVLRIERPLARGRRGLAGTPEGTRYRIGEVYVTTVRPQRGVALTGLDTLRENGYSFIYRDHLPYRTKPLAHPLFLTTDELFRQRNADRTYRRLTGLNVFDRVDIAYDTTHAKLPGTADARITLLPGKHQGFSLEGFLTNRGGALGTSVNLGYRHKNLFRSLASLQASITVGLEAQQRITGQNGEGDVASTAIGTGSLFNTVSIGPELTFGFPIYWGLFSKSSNAKLLVNGLFNYQRRPDFTRDLGRLSLGVLWQESRANVIGMYPLEVNVVKLPVITNAFADYLDAANNPVLRDSYTDHLITSMRGVFTHTTPDGDRLRNSRFLRLSGEWAHNGLRSFAQQVEDTLGQRYYTLAGIRYAEFVRLEVDARFRHTIHEKSSVAFRLAGGAGLPYGNLGVLPFESSFFVGGANGLRAWRARSIGPGSYSAPLTAFDRIGEMRLEGNAEYRFKLIGFLEGALFADVGNIWNLKETEGRPGGAISSKFLSELAVGTGVGARLNFDFFIVRFDFGLQTKDPSLPPGERWLFQPKDEHEAYISSVTGSAYSYKPEVNFNLGIGYPF